MALREFVSRQVDYTAQDCVIPAALNQGFDTLQPDSDIGFIIWSELSPDVVTYPILKNFFWAATSGGVSTGEFYYWAGTDWELLNLEDGARLLPGTVPISALSAAGALPLDIIQVNSLGTGYQFVNLITAIPLNSLDLTKLKATIADNGKIISVVGGVATYVQFDGTFIIANIADNTLPINKLIRGTAKQILRTNSAATGLEWVDIVSAIDDNTVPVAKLAAGVGNALKIVRVNSAGLAMELATPPFSTTTVRTSTAQPVPTAGTYVEYTHGLTAPPTYVDCFFVCNTAHDGFSIGDKLSWTACTNNAGPTFQLTEVSAGTKVRLLQNTSGATREIFNNTTGNVVTFVPANWDVYLQATLIS